MNKIDKELEKVEILTRLQGLPLAVLKMFERFAIEMRGRKLKQRKIIKN